MRTSPVPEREKTAMKKILTRGSIAAALVGGVLIGAPAPAEASKPLTRTETKCIASAPKLGCIVQKTRTCTGWYERDGFQIIKRYECTRWTVRLVRR